MNITVGAIQPGSLWPSPQWDCLREGFVGDVAGILTDHVLPNLEISLALLQKCGMAGCDLATTSEDACQISYYLLSEPALFDALVEESARIAEERFAHLARTHHMYIAACYFKRTDGQNYNVCSIFDRDGAIVGEYRKTHLPPNERWHVAEGESIHVIPLDIGDIGIAICYDMMFPEMVSALALRGAQLILHPTAGYGWYDSIGEATLRTRANDNAVYVLTAKNYAPNAAGHSSVIDPWGRVLADAGTNENVIIYHTVDLQSPKVQPSWFYPTQMSGIAEVGERKLLERRPELYGALTEPCEKLGAPDNAQRQILRQKVKDGECRW